MGYWLNLFGIMFHLPTILRRLWLLMGLSRICIMSIWGEIGEWMGIARRRILYPLK